MNHYASISSQVLMLHEELRQAWPHLKRIAIALYDASSDELHTFANATEGGSPLAHYSQRLSALPSLKTLAEKQESRIVDDLEVFRASP